MTTLELARAVADAVLATTQRRNNNPMLDAPTQAVLRTLKANEAWFVRAADEPEELASGPRRVEV